MQQQKEALEKNNAVINWQELAKQISEIAKQQWEIYNIVQSALLRTATTQLLLTQLQLHHKVTQDLQKPTSQHPKSLAMQSKG
ncbi:MAG: hypothetical protein HWD61_07360 [Parachlamydiaceae bacterium]|nr:MAG: hypothetical protein HWD61_07360 [Parachlamydiaceae bacterium]